MGFDPISAVADLLKTGLEKWIPDANERAKAAAAIAEQVHTEVIAQIEVNKAEAASSSLFVAGWRPFIGWVCGSAFAYQFVLMPFMLFLVTLFHIPFDVKQLPVLDLGTMMPVLFGMLGLGAMRSYEKVNGVVAGH